MTDNTANTSVPMMNIIPKPLSVTSGVGTLTLSGSSRIVATDSTLEALAHVLQGEINLLRGLNLLVIVPGSPQNGDIVLSYDSLLNGEEYKLDIDTKATVYGANYQIVALGISSLIQLIGYSPDLPYGTIQDAPAADFRSLFIDVARRYHTVDQIKNIIKMCQLYKVRYLHIHFTDDQSFMFPSTTYPKLDSKNDHGYPAYTLAELQDLETYSVERGVVIIPELEIPGHSSKMKQIYPSVFGDFHSPQARNGCKTLIDEMLAVFQTTPYFHTGGDESGFDDLADFINDMKPIYNQKGKEPWFGKDLVQWKVFQMM